MNLGINYILDPRVKGTLNIVSASPMPRDLTYQVLLSALRLQGFAAVESNGVTTILPEADAKFHGTPVEVVLSKGQAAASRQAGKAGGERLITQVFALKNESALQLVPILRPLIASNNTIAVNANNNTLVITDYADNIARLSRVIEGVDRPQSDVVMIPAVHASAIDLAATLNRLFADTPGGPAGAGKSTVGRRLAQTLHYLYLDSGSLYRAVAWQAGRLGLELSDADALAAFLPLARQEVQTHAGGKVSPLDGVNNYGS